LIQIRRSAREWTMYGRDSRMDVCMRMSSCRAPNYATHAMNCNCNVNVASAHRCVERCGPDKTALALLHRRQIRERLARDRQASGRSHALERCGWGTLDRQWASRVKNSPTRWCRHERGRWYGHTP